MGQVSKWLADQQGITPERPTSPDADLLDAKRRRKPRIDPSLLDWNRLSGEENVSVVNRLTGKAILEFSNLGLPSFTEFYRVFFLSSPDCRQEDHG